MTSEQPWVDALRSDPSRAKVLRFLLVDLQHASPIEASAIAGWIAAEAPRDLSPTTMAKYRALLEQLGPPAPPTPARRPHAVTPVAAAGRRRERRTASEALSGPLRAAEPAAVGQAA